MTKEEQEIFIAKAIGLEVIFDPCGPISLTKTPYRVRKDVFIRQKQLESVARVGLTQ